MKNIAYGVDKNDRDRIVSVMYDIARLKMPLFSGFFGRPSVGIEVPEDYAERLTEGHLHEVVDYCGENGLKVVPLQNSYMLNKARPFEIACAAPSEKALEQIDKVLADMRDKLRRVNEYNPGGRERTLALEKEIGFYEAAIRILSSEPKEGNVPGWQKRTGEQKKLLENMCAECVMCNIKSFKPNIVILSQSKVIEHGKNLIEQGYSLKFM